MERGLSREVRGPVDPHAPLDDLLIRLRQLAVAALARGHVDDHRARRHAADHVGGHDHRGLLPLDLCRCDDGVARGDHPRHLLALAAELFLAHLLRVAAGGLGVGGFEIELHELRPQRLDLLLDGGADVVALHHRAEPPGRGDGLQSGDAGPDHEHARRGDGAGGGGHHRKHLRKGLRGEQHRLVAAHRGLRRQPVHRLGPGYPRHQLDGERGHAPRGDVARGFGMSEGIGEPDQDLTLPHPVEVLAAAFEVLAQRPDLEDDVGREHVVAGAGPAVLGGVLIVGEPGGEAGAPFHQDLDAGLLQRRQRGGRQCDARLTGVRLSGDTDQHDWRRVPNCVPAAESMRRLRAVVAVLRLLAEGDRSVPGALGNSRAELLAVGAYPLDRGGAPPALCASGEEHPHRVTPFRSRRYRGRRGVKRTADADAGLSPKSSGPVQWECAIRPKGERF